MSKHNMVVVALAGAALAAQAGTTDDIAALKAQMDALVRANAELTRQVEHMREKLSKVEKDAAGAAAAPVTAGAKVVLAGDEDGTLKLPGSSSSVGLYGFVHVDAWQDTRQSSADWALDPGSIGIRNAAGADPSGIYSDTRAGKVNMSARVSRFGFKSHTPTDAGTLRTKLELDFYRFGNSDNQMVLNNGFNPRLRHAYGELTGGWGTLLAGQSWSTFMNLDATPETVDFNGHGSAQLMRQAMLRYARSVGEAGTFSVALENGATQVNNAYQPQRDPSIDKGYDAVIGWSWSGRLGTLAAQALATRYQYENQSTLVATDKRAFGFSLGGALKLGGKDTMQALYTTGDGIARYLPSASYNFEAYDSARNELLLSKAWAVTLGWAHAWSDAVRTNLSWGSTRLDTPANYLAAYSAALSGATSANQQVDSAFANLFWGFAKNTELGLEYAWARRRLNSGESGDYGRVQASVQFNF